MICTYVPEKRKREHEHRIIIHDKYVFSQLIANVARVKNKVNKHKQKSRKPRNSWFD